MMKTLIDMLAESLIVYRRAVGKTWRQLFAVPTLAFMRSPGGFQNVDEARVFRMANMSEERERIMKCVEKDRR